jgi:hypothetical protein
MTRIRADEYGGKRVPLKRVFGNLPCWPSGSEERTG